MRIRRGNVCRNRHKKILKLAKGFKGARSRIFKVANIAVMKALKYAYRDRRATKRNMRRLWIVRINAEETKYDMELQQIETTRKALTTEYDGIKQIIDDNIKRTFKIFS